MIVVADSSPLIILSKLHRIDLLEKLFGEIFISEEVYSEVVIAGSGLPGSEEVAAAQWIQRRTLDKTHGLSLARTRLGLGLGELSTIALAKELQAEVVLIDDRSARKLARSERLQPIGSLGLLEMSYQRGYLSDLRLTFSELLHHGAFVDRTLLNQRLTLLKLNPL